MESRELVPVGAPTTLRRGRFEDVPGILRLIGRALETGCREVYDQRQRRWVYTTYASSLFIDSVGPLETLVAESDGRLAGVAQLDPRSGILRALFVDDGFQGRGVGRALLERVEARARAAGCARLHGAMSLNAIAFYRSAGFLPSGEAQSLRGDGVRVPVLWMEKSLRP
jgi:putative acetyltransferase